MIDASELIESAKQRGCNAFAMGIIFGYTESMFLAAIMTMERAITTSDEEGGALLPPTMPAGFAPSHDMWTSSEGHLAD